MRAPITSGARVAEGVVGRLMLLWAGLSLGVAFVATPAKFLAPSLSLPVALDVGRRTFQVYNGAELVLLGLLVVAAVWVGARRRWILALGVPAAISLLQALWLLPALDVRVSTILRGGQPPPSDLHAVYIAAEVLKLAWLMGFGLIGQHERAAPSPATGEV
jgi:hypothetical protein